MRKTLLSALVIGASVFTVSAFAQVNLGGAAHVNAGVHAGVAAPSVMHTADQATTRTQQTLHRSSSHLKRHTRKAAKKAHSTVNDHANANANANANGANAKVDTGAGLDTAATAGKAGDMGKGVGGDVRDTAHSTIQSADRTAGSVGDAVKGVNASGNADANANAKASTHGH